MPCSYRFRRRFRALGLALALVSLLAVQGCSMGFTNLHPGENSALYQHLFADLITLHDEPYWLWVRGTIAGDLDGDGVVQEEIVLATIQKGTQKQPGPIEMAFLVACSIEEDGTRQAIARQLLFDNSPVLRAPQPEFDVARIVDNPFTRCRAQMIQDKETLAETVLVYFWTDPLPCSVWYAGYGLHDGTFVKNMESVMWQITPGALSVNLDRSIEARPFGYQLVFGVSALPAPIAWKIGRPSDAPVWGHVFARNANGYYEQADLRFAEHYSKLEPAWNQAYLKAIVKGLPTEDLAWFEYHLALLNYYTGERELSRAFVKKAMDNATDPALVEAVARVDHLINSAAADSADKDDGDDKPKTGEPGDWHPDRQWEPEAEWIPSPQTRDE